MATTNCTELLHALDHLGNPRLLVVGDLILDRYTWGDAERVSQEAPVILLRSENREARLGGAANVCHMLRGLNAEVTCVGVVGADADGQELADLLAAGGVDCHAVLPDASRPTTVKERFIGRAAGRHPHQILRVDREVREPVAQPIEDALYQRLLERLDDCQAVLISDYAKGVCTPGLLERLIPEARRRKLPVIVDPTRGGDYRHYRGATTMTPNRLEAGMAAGLTIRTPEEATEAGRRLCRWLELKMAIITLDSDGMQLVYADGRSVQFPTRARAVYDITGAGDVVLATVGMCLAAGCTPETTVQLGNVAGGIEVEKVGVAPVSREEMRWELHSRGASARSKIVRQSDLASLGATLHAGDKRIVFTNGCFDLLHVGHVTYLEEAAALGDVLVVGVNSDSSVSRLKGPARPVIGEMDRCAMLASLACVDYVVTFEQDTPHDLLHALRPDVLVKGGTYRPDEVVGHEVVTAYGGEVCVMGVVDGVSTTKIVASVANRQNPPAPHFRLVHGDAESASPETSPKLRESA